MPDDARHAPAGGQTLRLPGSARAATLHEQLYRYADDLHQAIERNDALQADNQQLRESAGRLLESREELDAILQTSLDIHLITDADGLIDQWNPASAALATPQALAGSRIEDWVSATHLPDFLAMRNNVLGGLRCPERGVELHLRCGDSRRRPLIAIGRVLVVRRGGNQRHLHWILRDITHLRETEFETKVASTVFSNANEGVMITDVEGGILAVNAAFTRITGYEAADALGRTPHFLASGHQSPDFYEAFWRALRNTGTWQGVLYNRRRDGETFLERLTVNAVRDTEGNILSYIAVFSDLTQAAPAIGIPHPPSAHVDPLSGLANGSLLADRLERMLLQSRRTEAPFSLLAIDIDGFTDFNRKHGHLAGDRLLRTVAARLSASLREADAIARRHADEFVVLAAGLATEHDVAGVCNKLLAALRTPIDVAGQDVVITASIGAASFPAHATEAGQLMSAAKAALAMARAEGGDAFAIHPAIETETRHTTGDL